MNGTILYMNGIVFFMNDIFLTKSTYSIIYVFTSYNPVVYKKNTTTYKI